MKTTTNPIDVGPSPNMSGLDDDVLLTAEDVARKLKISRTKAYEMIKFGELPSISLGRLVRVRIVDLNAFIVQNLKRLDNAGR